MAALAVAVVAGCAAQDRHSTAREGYTTEHGGLRLVYAMASNNPGPLARAAIDRAAQIMRERLFGLGLYAPDVRSLRGELIVTLPGARPGSRAAAELGRPGRVLFYDWEPDVIGPSGKPEPTDVRVTGGSKAGLADFGLPEYQAVLRAAKRPPIIRRNDTTLGPGVYGQYYLLDDQNHRVLRGPADTVADLYADDYRPPVRPRPRVVHVNPGTTLVQASSVIGSHGGVALTEPNSWYVLDDNPVLGGADVTYSQQELSSRGKAYLRFCLKPYAEHIYQRLIMRIIQRDREAQSLGESDTEQHFAVALDDKLIVVPNVIDSAWARHFTHAADQLCSDLGEGAKISSYQLLAGLFKTPALPVRLTLISQSLLTPNG
jgi:SecD/SecF fusion protein